jgi:hypothetical protein
VEEYPGGGIIGPPERTTTRTSQNSEERRRSWFDGDRQNELIISRVRTWESGPYYAGFPTDPHMSTMYVTTRRTSTPEGESEDVATSEWSDGKLSTSTQHRESRTLTLSKNYQYAREYASVEHEDGGSTVTTTASNTWNWQEPEEFTEEELIDEEEAEETPPAPIPSTPATRHTLRVTLPGAARLLPFLRPHLAQVPLQGAVIVVYRFQSQGTNEVRQTIAAMRLVRWTRATAARSDTLVLECEQPVYYHRARTRTASEVFQWTDTTAEIVPVWDTLPGDLVVNGSDGGRRFIIGTVSLSISSRRAVMQLSARER